MATGAEIARTRYAEVQGITRSVVEAVQALWRDVSPDRILIAMQGETGRQILEAVIAGQLSAAQGAQAFVSACLLADGGGFAPRGKLIPSRLAGIAMDGRPLASLLFMPAVTTARALALGMSPERSALLGLNQMALLTSTVVADTARSATSVAMSAERTTVRYVRVVSAPACGRCIILAGREYSYSTGFRRHPRCDCGMRPVRSDAE
ncbi:VG15 protein [Streptomyces harbinensis]